MPNSSIGGTRKGYIGRKRVSFQSGVSGVGGSNTGGGGSSYPITDDAPAIIAAITASKGGTYTLPARTLYFPNGLSLTGTNSAGTTIKGQAGTTVVLGQPVTGWKPISSSDPDYAAFPSASLPFILVARPNIVRSQVVGFGNELILGGATPSVQTLPTYPPPTGGTRSDGWADITGTATTFTSGVGVTNTASDANYTGINYSRTLPVICQGFTGTSPTTYPFTSQVTSATSTQISLKGYSNQDNTSTIGGASTDSRLQMVNVPEYLQVAGQYWIDGSTGTIYWYPPASYTGTQPVYLSWGPGITLTSSAMNVTIQGVSSSAALYIVGGLAGVSFDATCTGLTLTDLGFYCQYGASVAGPTVNLVTVGLTVNTCDFVQSGGVGVIVGGGNRTTRTASNNLIENCIFQKSGRLLCGSASGWAHSGVIAAGFAPTVETSYFSLCPMGGIVLAAGGLSGSQGSAEAVVSGNKFDQIGAQNCDFGAVYLGQSWSSVKTTYTNNTFTNCNPYAGQGTGQHFTCIYWDDGLSGQTATNNTFGTAGGPCETGLFANLGWANTVTNNQFYCTGQNFFLAAPDQRVGSTAAAQAQGPNGFLYQSITYWNGGTWGVVPAAWVSAGYNNLDGAGNGLSTMMALYPGSGTTASSGYGSPLYENFSGNFYSSAQSLVWFNITGGHFLTDAGGGTFNQVLNDTTFSMTTFTAGSSGGASAFTGRTTLMASE